MAFTSEEQRAILMMQVDNSSAQGYSNYTTSGSNNTQDRIFLLSYAEANGYLGVIYGDSGNIKSRVSPTAYAVAQGTSANYTYKTEKYDPTGWWWLRSPGHYQNSAAIVSNDGSLTYYSVNDDRGVVRPAFWLDLESDIF